MNRAFKLILIASLSLFASSKLTESQYKEMTKDSTFEVLDFETFSELFPDFEYNQTKETTVSDSIVSSSSNKVESSLSFLEDELKDVYNGYNDVENFSQCYNNVKEQKNCGGCWAFAVTSSLEAMNCRALELFVNVQLSPQTLLSCIEGFGCGRGNLLKAWSVAADFGVHPEYCYPYSSQRGSLPRCPSNDPLNLANQCDKVYAGKDKYAAIKYPKNDLESVKKHIKRYGSVTASIRVSSAFATYKSGVYQYGKDKTFVGHHAVVFVGYNRDENKREYLIGLNSYGKKWGLDGFFKIYADDLTESEVLSNVVGGYSSWTAQE